MIFFTPSFFSFFSTYAQFHTYLNPSRGLCSAFQSRLQFLLQLSLAPGGGGGGLAPSPQGGSNPPLISAAGLCQPTWQVSVPTTPSTGVGFCPLAPTGVCTSSGHQDAAGPHWQFLPQTVAIGQRKSRLQEMFPGPRSVVGLSWAASGAC